MAEAQPSIYEENFQKALEALQVCQKEKGFSSCFACEKVLECDVRDDYVKKTYERMNKGATGGFEF